MSTEQFIRDFYNAMHSVHVQPGNAYDLSDQLQDLTVHKHLDQDPLIQFREVYRWLRQAGVRLIADAGCGYGGFAVYMASQMPAMRVDGYTLSDVQQAVAQQVFAHRHMPQARVLLQSYDHLVQQYDAIVAIESLGHAADAAATLQHWARHLRSEGLVVIIDEVFRPEASPAHPEIQQFMQLWRFSVLLQRARVEALVQAAGLQITAWDVLSERYHVPNRPDDTCDQLLRAYQEQGAHPGYIGGILLEKFYNRGWVDYVLMVLTLRRSRESYAAQA
jgi:cyclopropane fatty-acyl-phospholipid synthase-like methyltransferase